MKFKKIALLFFLILQPNVANTVGMSYVSVLYLNFLLFFTANLLVKKKTRNFYLFSIFLVGLLFFRYRMGILPESIQFCLTMITPAFLAFILPEKINRESDFYFYRFLLNGVFVYYCLEVLFAVLENIGHFSILHYTNSTYGVSEKLSRSVALSGAPLTNSLIICALLMFVLNSNLKQTLKFGIWGGGMVSLLCFQGRIACIVSALYLVYYLLTHFSGNIRKNISVVLMFVICVAILTISLYFGLGARLFDSTLFSDSSSGERFKMFEYLMTINASEFLYGTSYKNVQYIMLQMHVLILECFFVIHCLLFGIVFTLICYFLYGLELKHLFLTYKIKEKIPIIIIFILVAFINNSFASTFVPMCFFVLFAKLFSPSIFNCVVPKKYLE